jgi:hypothetical protein
MKTTSFRFLPIAAIVLVAAAVAGCASPASRESMAPPAAVATKQLPFAVSVDARGGSETGVMDSSNISNADFKAAIESAIAQSRLFRSVVQGKGGDYDLTVTVISLSKPTFGASMTVDMEAGWMLTRGAEKSVVLRKTIKSTHTAAWNEAFAGVTRLRFAVEGAARSNITQGLQAIAALQL